MQCCASAREQVPHPGPNPHPPHPHPTPPPQYPTLSVTRERVRLLGGRHVRSAGRACVSGCAPPHPNLPKA